jgi:hypothetical protein
VVEDFLPRSVRVRIIGLVPESANVGRLRRGLGSILGGLHRDSGGTCGAERATPRHGTKAVARPHTYRPAEACRRGAWALSEAVDTHDDPDPAAATRADLISDITANAAKINQDGETTTHVPQKALKWHVTTRSLAAGWHPTCMRTLSRLKELVTDEGDGPGAYRLDP